jgi:hypothetical protein
MLLVFGGILLSPCTRATSGPLWKYKTVIQKQISREKIV